MQHFGNLPKMYLYTGFHFSKFSRFSYFSCKIRQILLNKQQKFENFKNQRSWI